MSEILRNADERSFIPEVIQKLGVFIYTQHIYTQKLLIVQNEVIQ